MLTLYGYWRSSAAYRVRIALNLKGLAHDTRSVDLRTGEQTGAAYAALNPSGLVPTLLTEHGPLTQSLAIIEWLEARHPEPPLLPPDPLSAAHVRAAAQTIACDVHPLNNLAVLGRLHEMGHDEIARRDWMHHWMDRGLTSFQAQLPEIGGFCFGDSPTLADLCLVPQLYNARRWALDLSRFERLTGIESLCLALPAFDAARPEVQPDAPQETKT
ncbi:maleylacetoacetate isomerase [Halovulum sp. GXIMD14794]